MYPDQEKLAVIKNSSLLHHAAKENNHCVMRIILKFLPDNLRLSNLTDKNKSGETPISIAHNSNRGEILNIMLSHLPEADRLLVSGRKENMLDQPLSSQSIFTMFQHYNHEERLKEERHN